MINGRPQAAVREGLDARRDRHDRVRQWRDADIIKINRDVTETVRQTGLRDGHRDRVRAGATGAVTTLEFEPGVVHDVQLALDQIAPPDRHYVHNDN